MGLTIEGHLDFTGVLHAADPETLTRAAHKGMEHISEVAAEQTPIEEGTLVRSRRIKATGRPGEVTLSYKGPYARYQHERLDLKHEHGNAKYLEGPMLSEKDDALDIAAREIRRSIT